MEHHIMDGEDAGLVEDLIITIIHNDIFDLLHYKKFYGVINIS
jgi:hypothetical protein